MKLFIAMLLVALAAPVYAADIGTIPVDGNGNPGPVIVDSSGNVLNDSGVRTIAGTVTASATCTGSVYVLGTPTVSATVTNAVADTPYTATNLAYDTAIAAATWDTFTLDRAYDLIYVSSDTDIVIALTATEVLAGYGEVAYAGVTIPYPYRTQYVYIKTKSGLALSGGIVSVRGMR